ncbi:Horcolin [Madurella mycetomatis]|uniref:Horcolin n=1 Tax=Madurella mycetomatis TaxID=100816 RepID=A0A175W3T2_9PEZI|nr:Horcolin [Madurella mycetomatis]
MKPFVTAAVSAMLLLDGTLAATSGTFNILAMNVAGLPAILNDNGVPGDKADNAAAIGAKLAEYGYDVVQLQEDFNYHAHIYRTDNHPFRTATSGGVPFGSGLNTVSNFDWVDFRRIKWDKCSDASQFDCLTPKGFTFMRVAISGPADNSTAVYADFYNVHTDAGVEDGDFDARNSNVNEVAAYIAEWSKGNAVLVYGDLNSRYSRDGDTAIRSLLASVNSTGPGLTDAWIDLQHGGTIPSDQSACGNPAAGNACEIVDKVFYRSSPLLTLQADTFRYDSQRFLQADGSILTDHNPVFVDFSWSSGLSLQQSNFFGGAYGTWFSDVPALANLKQPKASTLVFRGGSRLDGVAVTLADGTRFIHGGTGGTEVSLTLEPSEYWVEAELCRGERRGRARNFYIQAVTSSGRSLAAGTATSDCATFQAPDGWHIVGFMGQDGDEMDQLAFVYAPQ